MRNAPEREQTGPRINEQIRVREVRLIDENGNNVGVVPKLDAASRALEAGLDLVEISPDAEPPVCKIMDFGKFKFQQKQKQKEKTKTHQQKLKEIRLRPKTDQHDVDTKVNQARKFLEHKDKVLIYVLYKGRELQHVEEGKRVLTQMLEKLQDLAKVEKAPSMEGKRMSTMLAPK